MYLTVSLIPFINKPDSSTDLTIFLISLISSFEIINAVVPNQKFLLKIVASVADAAAVNPNDINTLLVNDFSRSLIKGKPVFINGQGSLPKNPPGSPILINYVFDNFILTDEPFTKAS